MRSNRDELILLDQLTREMSTLSLETLGQIGQEFEDDQAGQEDSLDDKEDAKAGLNSPVKQPEVPSRKRERDENRRRPLLGGVYDLEEGKQKCSCLRRKWKFCTRIKSLADGKVTPALVKTRSMKDTREDNLL